MGGAPERNNNRTVLIGPEHICPPPRYNNIKQLLWTSTSHLIRTFLYFMPQRAHLACFLNLSGFNQVFAISTLMQSCHQVRALANGPVGPAMAGPIIEPVILIFVFNLIFFPTGP